MDVQCKSWWFQFCIGACWTSLWDELLSNFEYLFVVLDYLPSIPYTKLLLFIAWQFPRVIMNCFLQFWLCTHCCNFFSAVAPAGYDHHSDGFWCSAFMVTVNGTNDNSVPGSYVAVMRKTPAHGIFLTIWLVRWLVPNRAAYTWQSTSVVTQEQLLKGCRKAQKGRWNRVVMEEGNSDSTSNIFLVLTSSCWTSLE